MKPLVTIVIATYNEEKHIGELLDCIEAQTYDCFEVRIYDGGSHDRTRDVISEHSLPVFLSENPDKWHVYAFNQGIKDAKGDLFLLLGAHSRIPVTFLEDLVSAYQKQSKDDSHLAAVGGSVNNEHTTRFGILAAIYYSTRLSGSSSFRYAKTPGFVSTVVYGLYRTDVLHEVGGFDTDYIIGQDYEINLRIRDQGYLLYQDPSITATHFMRTELRKFLKQLFRYGAVKGMILRQRKPLTLLTALLISSAGLAGILMVQKLILLVGIYFAAVLITAVSQRNLRAIHLLYLFPLGHIASVLGLLRGAILGRRTFQYLKHK